MRSLQLQEALREFLGEASACLQGELAAGAEVPFELAAQGGRGRGGRSPLYCYRPLTGEFIKERAAMIASLPGHARAARLLEEFPGLDRYLLAHNVRAAAGGRASAALRALAEDAFHEQSDFQLAPARIEAALSRMEDAACGGAGEVTIAVTLHGLALGSSELMLPGGLLIASPEAVARAPEELLSPSWVAPGGWQGPSWEGGAQPPAGHLVALYTAGEGEAPHGVLREGRRALRELLLALRLFGDGRIAMGPLAWACVDGGSWAPLALGWGGRPHGMLVIAPEQEDELRAFCSLVARRAPRHQPLAWALRRYELGCERASEHEALSDYLLALEALLEPERTSPGRLAVRVAALCATGEMRARLSDRVVQAVALEHEIIEAGAPEHAGGIELVREIAGHLRALLRDVICGHLDADLITLADQLLLEADEHAPAPAPVPARAARGGPGRAGEGEDPLRRLAEAMPLF